MVGMRSSWFSLCLGVSVAHFSLTNAEFLLPYIRRDSYEQESGLVGPYRDMVLWCGTGR